MYIYYIYNQYKLTIIYNMYIHISTIYRSYETYQHQSTDITRVYLT